MTGVCTLSCFGVGCVQCSDRAFGLERVQVAAIKKEDIVTEDDDVKEEPVEEEQEQAGEIEKESGARRRTRRDT